MWSNPNLRRCQWECKNGTATLRNQFSSFSKGIITLTYDEQIPPLGILSQRNEKYTFAQNICSHMHVNAFRGFVHTVKTLNNSADAHQLKMHKQTMYPHN